MFKMCVLLSRSGEAPELESIVTEKMFTQRPQREQTQPNQGSVRARAAGV